MSDEKTPPTGSRWAVGAMAEEGQEPSSEPVTKDSERRRFFSKAPAAEETPEPSGVNPFLPPSDAAAVSALVDDDTTHGHGLSDGLDHTTGPTAAPIAPAPAKPALPIPAMWPVPERPCSGTVQLLGLHGGAGTSTVAALIGPEAVDCGVGLDQLRSMALPVLFVTRTHAHGLDLALRLGQQHAARSFDTLMVLGLVVVHDAPTLSRGLARKLRSAQRTLPNCWTVPWDEDLRHQPDLPASVAGRGRTARDVRRILKKADRLTQSGKASHQSNNQLRQVR